MSQNGTIMLAKQYYYAGSMLDAPPIVLCSKLCLHVPSASMKICQNQHLFPRLK